MNRRSRRKRRIHKLESITVCDSAARSEPSPAAATADQQCHVKATGACQYGACRFEAWHLLPGRPGGLLPQGPHRSGCGEHNAHLVTPGQIPPTLPIIGLPALLRLVEWYQERRRNTQQGGLSCVNFEPSLSPPRQQDRSSTESSADMGGPCRRASRTNSQRADPRRRPTTGEASGHEGGDA